MPLTISREDRDVLHAEARRTLDTFDDVGLRRPDLATTEGVALARRQARRLQRAFAMLENLGWAEVDDRDTYEIPIDELVVEWLRTQRTEIKDYINDQTEILCAQHAGDEEYFIDDCSQGESVAITRAEIDQEDSLHELLGRLLGDMFDDATIRGVVA